MRACELVSQENQESKEVGRNTYCLWAHSAGRGPEAPGPGKAATARWLLLVGNAFKRQRRTAHGYDTGAAPLLNRPLHAPPVLKAR